MAEILEYSTPRYSLHREDGAYILRSWHADGSLRSKGYFLTTSEAALWRRNMDALKFTYKDAPDALVRSFDFLCFGYEDLMS